MESMLDFTHTLLRTHTTRFSISPVGSRIISVSNGQTYWFAFDLGNGVCVFTLNTLEPPLYCVANSLLLHPTDLLIKLPEERPASAEEVTHAIQALPTSVLSLTNDTEMAALTKVLLGIKALKRAPSQPSSKRSERKSKKVLKEDEDDEDEEEDDAEDEDDDDDNEDVDEEEDNEDEDDEADNDEDNEDDIEEVVGEEDDDEDGDQDDDEDEEDEEEPPTKRHA